MGVAHGTKYDTRDRPAFLLPRSKQFVVQDAWDSVATYGIKDGEVVHKFPARERVNKFDVTADEEFLVIACADGSVGVWELETGNRRWWKGQRATGLNYIYDVSFARDGKSLVLSSEAGYAAIYETQTGLQKGTIRFPPNQTSIMSAALSPDGSRGVLIDLGERLFTFDVGTGLMKDTGLKGAWPVRYSSDGSSVAMRSSNSGRNEKLRIVTIGDNFKVEDIGQFSRVGSIRATSDGGFRAAASVPNAGGTRGIYYDAKSVEIKEAWSMTRGPTDFDLEHMLGVYTDFRLVTKLIDLRNSAVLLSVDNSANARLEMISTTVGGSLATKFWPIVVILLGLVLVIAVVAIVVRHSHSHLN
jgi:hypothetical protein